MIQRYYEEEMRYLREAGQAFAEAHPDIAHYLNIASLTDRDPYVERLFEGFAFLAGRIHERLDDELPSYTESLLGLLAPHLTKPFPSCCIVEFSVIPGLLQEPRLLPKGTEVHSRPVGQDATVCRFATTQATLVQPLQLTDAQVKWRAGKSGIVLRFEVERGVELNTLDLRSLRLYFNDVPDNASLLHLFFTRHLERVECRGLESTGGEMTLRGQQWVRPAGLSAEESLLPSAANSLTSFRLLQEYWCFRNKFWFVDLLGLDAFAPDEQARGFEVELHFDRAFPEDRRLGERMVRLHCAPVVNIFEMDAEPIRAEGMASEYHVQPSVRHRDSIEIYEVDEVLSIEDTTGRRHTYFPYLAFREASKASAARSFMTRRRMVERGLDEAGRPRRYLDTFLSLGTPAGEGPSVVSETLSLRVRCTNGSVPFLLNEGQVQQLAPDAPQVVRPSNLTKPTYILYPPIHDQKTYFWKLISQWSFNYMSVANRDALVGLLELYDWSVKERMANQKRLRGIDAVSWKAKERQERRAILRGAEVTLQVKEESFASEGDLCLFGLILSDFLSRYATINSFVDLRVKTIPSGKQFEWRPKKGMRPLL